MLHQDMIPMENPTIKKKKKKSIPKQNVLTVL